MVEDVNNIPDAMAAIEDGLDIGMQNLHEDVLNAVLSNWDNGADATGNAWEPLADGTIRASGSDEVLVESGQLRQNVRSTSEFSDRELTSVIGTTSPVAGIHEYGLPERGIPARPFIAPAGRYALDNAHRFVDSEIDTRLESTTVD